MSRRSSGARLSNTARTIAGSAKAYASTRPRAASHEPRGVGCPGGSARSGWRKSSSCQPRPASSAERSKFGAFAASPASSCGSSFARNTRTSAIGAPRLDHDAAAPAPAGELHDPLEQRRPHVELRLLREGEELEEDVDDPVGAPGPRLDLEDEPLLGARAEFDLARLQVAGERREA